MKSHNRIPFLASVCVVLLICLANVNGAAATSIYTFSLPANGSVSAFSIQLTFSGDLLPAGGLLVFPMTSPVVTSLSFTTPGFNPTTSVLGLQITPTATLVGLVLQSVGTPPQPPLLFTAGFPADFFMFSRTPTATGTFSSFSGNVVSSLPLNTSTPVGTLTVTSVPEPSSLLLLGSGLLTLAGCRLLRQSV